MRAPIVRRFRIAYEKTGALRAISHRDLIQVLTRALRRSHLPLRYSEGFSPRPKISFAPPLPVGVNGRTELLDAELTRPHSPDDFLVIANRHVPGGLSFIGAESLLVGAPGLSEVAVRSRYRFTPLTDLPPPRTQELMDSPTLTVDKRTKKGDQTTVDVRPLLHAVTLVEGSVDVDMDASPQTIPPLTMARLLWDGLPENVFDVLDIDRVGFMTATGRLVRPRG